MCFLSSVTIGDNLFVNYLNDKLGSTFVKFVNNSMLSEVARAFEGKIKTPYKISKMKFSTDKGEKMKRTGTSRE